MVGLPDWFKSRRDTLGIFRPSFWWYVVVVLWAIIQAYDGLVGQVFPSKWTEHTPRVADIIPGWSWQIWLFIGLGSVLVVLFEGTHRRIQSLEQVQRRKLRIRLLSYSVMMISIQDNTIAYTIALAITNNLPNVHCGVSRFVLELIDSDGDSSYLHPVDEALWPSEIPREYPVLSPTLHLAPRQPVTGQLVFLAPESGHKIKLLIEDEEGATIDMDVSPATMIRLSKQRKKGYRI